MPSQIAQFAETLARQKLSDSGYATMTKRKGASFWPDQFQKLKIGGFLICRTEKEMRSGDAALRAKGFSVRRERVSKREFRLYRKCDQ